MAKGQQRSNREIRKPKKAKPQPQAEPGFGAQIKAVKPVFGQRVRKG